MSRYVWCPPCHAAPAFAAHARPETTHRVPGRGTAAWHGPNGRPTGSGPWAVDFVGSKVTDLGTPKFGEPPKALRCCDAGMPGIFPVAGGPCCRVNRTYKAATCENQPADDGSVASFRPELCALNRVPTCANRERILA